MRTLRWLVQVIVAVAGVFRDRRRRGPARPGWTLRTELSVRVAFVSLDHAMLNGVDWFRRLQSLSAVRSPALRKVRFTRAEVGGVSGLWCRPRQGECTRGILYLHGGGYVFGSARDYRELCARLALGARAEVFCPDYRRAPEHRYPAAHDDVRAVWEGLVAEGRDPARWTWIGDSAGGGLVMGALIRLNDTQRPLPAAACLLSPWVDPYADGGSMRSNQRTDILSRDWLVWCADQYVPELYREDPHVVSVRAAIAGLPPLYIEVGTAEVLLDQAIDLAGVADRAGVKAELRKAPEMFHEWQLLAPQLEESRRTIECVCGFVRASTPDP